MTGAELVRWERLRTGRAAHAWSSRWLVAIVAGAALAALVAWRAGIFAGAHVKEDALAASHVWLAGAIAACAVAFMRVPFHLYWRADAALLAQLPIPGEALFAAAFGRCARAGVATALACALGALPLARDLPAELVARHLALAGALGLAAACLLPAVAIWAAMTVVAGDRARSTAAFAVQIGLAAATANPARAARAVALQPPGSSSAVLGALPGFASSVVIVLAIAPSAWLTGGDPQISAPVAYGAIAAASIAAILAARAAAPRAMGAILREVSALDRQRLASLEIRPPTALERAVAGLLGAAALPYRKDAQLMRRRYPMAFALGGLAFLVLAIVGFARPSDPAPWLVAVLAGGALYGAALAGRLRRPPIELPRLASTLPISPRARAVAKLAWLATWLAIFLVAPAIFALARTL